MNLQYLSVARGNDNDKVNFEMIVPERTLKIAPIKPPIPTHNRFRNILPPL